MKRLYSLLGGALFTFACLGALPTAAQEPGPAVRPALWKVADKDTTIWLFGTIHVLPSEVDWHTGIVAQAFDSAQQLVTEIPIDDSAAAPATILEKSLRSDGRTLRDTLGETQRAAYEGALTSLGIPVQAFDGNDAWYAALMLTLIPLKAAGYGTETGIDAQVAVRARERQLTNHAFETVDYQIGLFDDLPEETQRTYLGEVVKALPDVKSDVDAMVAAWKAGDAEHLAQLLNEDESDPQMKKVLITDRNAAWAKWLKKRLKKPGTVFVAVGAGHLAGAGSVQDQLAAAGVRSTRAQ